MKNAQYLFIIVLCYVAMTGKAQNNRFTPPIMGWSSWNTYRININEQLIKKQADAIIDRGLKTVGYRYINIDDGFFGWRDESGILHTHPKRFPNGLENIVKYIHDKGLKAGIYSDAGSNTCGSIWDNDPNGIGVGLYGHEKQDADLFFNKWGVDFIKIDYCGAGQELALDEQKRYTEIYRAFNDITPEWASIKHIINKNLYLSAYARNGHYNDMDMLEIGRGLKPEEEEVHFGMWCIMSSPLLIGCDLTTIPDKSNSYQSRFVRSSSLCSSTRKKWICISQRY